MEFSNRAELKWPQKGMPPVKHRLYSLRNLYSYIEIWGALFRDLQRRKRSHTRKSLSKND